MRVIITGSRNWRNELLVRKSLVRFVFDKPTILVGDCRTGVDAIARHWCRRAGVHVQVFHADWGKHGAAAGPIRNSEMVQSGADLCIGFVDAESVGTRGCLLLSWSAGIPTHAYVLGTGWVSGPELYDLLNGRTQDGGSK